MPVALLLLAAHGCQRPPVRITPQPATRPAPELTPAEADARAEAVRLDPLGYLRRVAAKCEALQQYTLTFTRTERRGLLGFVYGPEHFQCRFRRRPFSVHMLCLDPASTYLESAYSEGQFENKVRFITRRWVPGLLPPPAINTVDLNTPVAIGETKRPLTDFGLERMMDNTLATFDAAGDEVLLTYAGLETLPETARTVHHLHFEYSPTRRKTPFQELYIDAATDLPAGSVIKLRSGDLDSSYFYTDINPAVHLRDPDFLLQDEQPDRKGAAARPAPTHDESRRRR